MRFLQTLGHNIGNTSCIINRNDKNLTGVRGVLNMEVHDGGGGGGGATYLFFVSILKCTDTWKI